MGELGLRLDIGIERAGRGQSFSLEVEFEAPRGVTILFGPSGSGKSTTLQAVAGLIEPDRGTIRLGDTLWYCSKSKTMVPAHQRQLAYVFQSLALFPHLTAVGNVMYGMTRGLPREERRERAMELLEKLGVGHLADRRPPTFSGGEAQRVALARAFARQPHIMLLDEPFSALDRDLRGQLTGLVKDLVREHDIPAIAVTHQHSQAEALGDQIVRLDRGRIEAIGSYAEVLG